MEVKISRVQAKDIQGEDVKKIAESQKKIKQLYLKIFKCLQQEKMLNKEGT